MECFCGPRQIRPSPIGEGGELPSRQLAPLNIVDLARIELASRQCE